MTQTQSKPRHTAASCTLFRGHDGPCVPFPPKPEAPRIVAECWTCALGGKPRRIENGIYSYIIGRIVNQVSECRAAGHDVRHVAREEE